MDVEYIEDKDIKVAFFPETKRFFKVNDKACEFINRILGDEEELAIIKDFGIDKKTYDKYYEKIFRTSKSINTIVDKDILSRLVIHITNDCNMRCVYCYADGGAYKSSRSIMSKEMMDKVIEVFWNKFKIISSVQFFGGEPLLNYDLLEYACEKIYDKGKERGYEIVFSIVTNGTMIEEKFIELVKKYNIIVTVSYDGNPKINDMQRVLCNGNPTSDIILKNVKRLKATTGQPSTIEVTYSQYHVNNGIRIMDIVEHINNELPNTYIHIVPVGTSSLSEYSVKDLSIFPESIKEIMEKRIKKNNFNMTYSLADRIFFALENLEMDIPKICDAGYGTLSVSIKGDVYTCFMFTDNENMKYGNIYDEDLFVSKKSRDIKVKLDRFSIKRNNNKCNSCFIRKLCNGCLGLNSFYSHSPFVLSDDICEMFKCMTREAVIGYTKLYCSKNLE